MQGNKYLCEDKSVNFECSKANAYDIKRTKDIKIKKR